MVSVDFYNTAGPRIVSPYDCSAASAGSEEYCQFDRFEACAMSIVCPTSDLGNTCTAAEQQNYGNFVACAEGLPYNGGKGKVSFSDASKCAKKLFTAAQVTSIEKCAGKLAGGSGAGSQAVTLLDGIQKVVKALKPELKYFPDIRINGKQCSGCQDEKTLLQTVCAAYTSDTKPAACTSAEKLPCAYEPPMAEN